MNPIIAIIGRVASGKSYIGSLFVKHGASLLDADEICNDIYSRNLYNIKGSMFANFGDKYFSNGDIDKNKIRLFISKDNNLDNFIKNTIHPIVLREIRLRVRLCTSKYCLLSLPIKLTREQMDEYNVSRVLCVDCEDSVQDRRIKSRKWSDDDYARIKSIQSSREVLLEIADDVIYNNEDCSEKVENAVIELHYKYSMITKVL